MDRTVKRVKHIVKLDADIDPDARIDVRDIDGHLNMCLNEANKALDGGYFRSFGDFERDNLKVILDCLKYSHNTIRELLKHEASPSSVDVLAIARLQVEALYTFCYCLQDVENVRHYLKYGWKQKYIRFLLHREEHSQLPRFASYFKNAFQMLKSLQKWCSISEDERHTIEEEQLGIPLPSGTKRIHIDNFPTPGKIVDRIRNAELKKMLERFYVEYEYLCIFAHGGADSHLFKVSLDKRSPVQSALSTAQKEDVFQRHVAETAITYSVISAVQCATEVAAVAKSCVDLQVKLSNAWSALTRLSLWAVPIWEMRAKNILPMLIV